MFDTLEPAPDEFEFVEGDFRDPGHSAFKRLMLALMALQEPGHYADEDDGALPAGHPIEVVIMPARITDREHIPARIAFADTLSPAHRLILEIIIAVHHETRLEEHAATDPATREFVFLTSRPGSGHARLEEAASAERILSDFLIGQGLTAADAAALIRPQ